MLSLPASLELLTRRELFLGYFQDDAEKTQRTKLPFNIRLASNKLCYFICSQAFCILPYKVPGTY